MCPKTAESSGATATTRGEGKDLPIPPNVHVSTHPVLSHKITILRSSSTLPSAFRSVLREVTYHLGYEATSGLTTRKVDITVPKGKDQLEATGTKLRERVAMIPIMRSGLGMVDSMLELLPNAGIHHIGMYKKEGSIPVQYYNRLPRKCESDVAYILDPMIATGTTTMSVIGILKKVCACVCMCV
uniref:uracil phosphoribosyltransferase n=1 Tax=Cyclophora tenuis TaxID=216820 RepID=A0A7S1GHZ8_CYCTE|mmetsp:Transcript_13600/g.23151  ORF Transcript_13600/g.23151 Transcript_13600/m.23151 type:complete len:185 (+) Transcript_13600:75-629(+)